MFAKATSHKVNNAQPSQFLSRFLLTNRNPPFSKNLLNLPFLFWPASILNLFVMWPSEETTSSGNHLLPSSTVKVFRIDIESVYEIVHSKISA
jgi:hypothetical protein